MSRTTRFELFAANMDTRRNAVSETPVNRHLKGILLRNHTIVVG